jgi:ribosomal protein S18 acetylase RimI-like enzyme
MLQNVLKILALRACSDRETMQRNRTVRPATVGDAALLAELINYAGEGLPLYLWGEMAEPGESAWDVGRRRAAREEDSFSYRNATIIEQDGQCGGCLIGYEIAENPEPIPDDMPAMCVPLQELENFAPGTWYMNVLAVRPQFRSQGLGTKLLALAEEIAHELGKRGTSVIISDTNLGARRLYERLGYNEKARRLMVKDNWQNEGLSWVLLTKNL